MVKVILHRQINELESFLEPHMLLHIAAGQANKYESYEAVTLIAFDWYNLENIQQPPAQIIIYYTKDHLFFLCENNECLEKVKSLVMPDMANERVVYSFFSELIRTDIEYLEALEEEITQTEDDLLTTSKKECAGEIIAFRRQLLRLKKYYEQLNQIFEGLTENEGRLIPEEDLRYFRILDNKIDRLFAHVLNLRDYVTQVREAYQAQIDIEQNSLMKIFTVVTAIFLPLTLIVGWYGMNLQMPEFSWYYAYPAVIGLCISVVVGCIVFFKCKKWF